MSVIIADDGYYRYVCYSLDSSLFLSEASCVGMAFRWTYGGNGVGERPRLSGRVCLMDIRDRFPNGSEGLPIVQRLYFVFLSGRPFDVVFMGIFIFKVPDIIATRCISSIILSDFNFYFEGLPSVIS